MSNPTRAQDLAYFDWELFLSIHSEMAQNASTGPALLFSRCLILFGEMKGREPLFDVHDAWNNCRPACVQLHPAGARNNPRPAEAQGVAS